MPDTPWGPMQEPELSTWEQNYRDGLSGGRTRTTENPLANGVVERVTIETFSRSVTSATLHPTSVPPRSRPSPPSSTARCQR
jgi:hypothetical protein